MANKRSLVTASVAGLVVAAVAFGGAALLSRDDPSVGVGPVRIGQVDLAGTTDDQPPDAQPPDAPPTGAQQVAALETVEGTLERRGDDPDDFYLGAVELSFGPDEWVLTAGPSDDYDGDGAPEDLLVELEGLIGQPVLALVRLDNDGDDADVYVLNDVTYRDSAGGPAPWQQTAATGVAAAPEEVAEAAAAAVGPGARVEELDRETVGDVAWEVDVVDADGLEHTVLLDAAAQVLDVRQDD